MPLKAPYPWFGGKASVAPLVWERFGDVRNFVDPFFGSGAILLSRPTPFEGTETVNDLDGLLANFWRAVAAAPDAVAEHADWPVNENCLHARHAWLVGRKDSLQARLEGDPDYFDAKVAGWWVWGLCLWIGSGWCSGKGPWQVVDRKLVHLGDAGRGINRQLVHLGDAGQGINRQLVHLGDAGQEPEDQGEASTASACRDWTENVHGTMAALSDRLRRVRVCCGDWSRVTGPTPTVKMGLTAVFLDPPYADTASRTSNLYRQDCLSVAHKVREWAIGWGDDPRMRIAYCSYGEAPVPEGWTRVQWKAKGGYGSQGEAAGRANAAREAIDFSPHCLPPECDRMPLFAAIADEPEPALITP
jgi:hypothetical protein